MSKFAKIIELKNDEQVLLTLNYNDEDDTYEVEVRTDLKGATIAIKLVFKNEIQALKFLEKYKEEDAVVYRHKASEMID